MARADDYYPYSSYKALNRYVSLNIPLRYLVATATLSRGYVYPKAALQADAVFLKSLKTLTHDGMSSYAPYLMLGYG